MRGDPRRAGWPSGIDAPALSRLQTGKMLNPTLATLHKWAEALGRKLDVDLTAA